MVVYPLFSSSKGNLFYLEDGNTSLIIDAGVSFKSVCLGLESIEKKIEDVDAILITHEHIDHIRALPLICKKHNIPIYTCSGTKRYLENFLESKNITANIKSLNYDETFKIKNLEITTFETSHDAIMPCGYYITNGTNSLVFATDLGFISDKILNYLNKADFLILESNYDNIMLQYGNYPCNLKRRILSDVGHLSNLDTANVLTSVLSNNPNKKVLLSHLSENNNTIDIAHDFVTSYLKENGINEFEINLATKDLTCEGYVI